MRTPSWTLNLCLGLLALGVPAIGITPMAADDSKPSDAIDIKDIDPAGLKTQIEQWKGKPVAMDVWATWCVPCKEKFPKFVKLSKAMKDKAKFFSMSIDDEESTSKARDYLKAQKTPFVNFRLKTDSDAFLGTYGAEGVPLYVVWDAQGKVVLKTDDIAKVEKKLHELTAKKSDS